MKFYTICDEATMKATYPSEPLFPCSICLDRICLAADGDRCPRCRQITLDALVAARPHHIDCGWCACPACLVATTAEGRKCIDDWNTYVASVGAQDDHEGALEPSGDIYVIPTIDAISGALFSRSLLSARRA